MSAPLDSARALLAAKNYPGARQAVQKVLDTAPGDTRAWHLRAEIEMAAGKPRDALAILRPVLADHPDNALLRSAEFDATLRDGQKREAARLRDRFAADFPYLDHRVEAMTLHLDAARGRTRSASRKLKEYGEAVHDPASLKGLGISHHRIDDIFRADRMMREAHEHFPGDAELNAALASNCFQLARPGDARRFARLALAADPTNRRMALLIKASWAMYFPPFWMLTAMVAVFYGVDVLLGRIAAYLSLVPILLLTKSFWDLPYDILTVATGVDIGALSIPCTFAWIAVYMLTTVPRFYDRFIGRRKSVSLKKY